VGQIIDLIKTQMEDASKEMDTGTINVSQPCHSLTISYADRLYKRESSLLGVSEIQNIYDKE
jgi:hypothetical protein